MNLERRKVEVKELEEDAENIVPIMASEFGNALVI